MLARNAGVDARRGLNSGGFDSHCKLKHDINTTWRACISSLQLYAAWRAMWSDAGLGVFGSRVRLDGWWMGWWMGGEWVMN